MFWIPGRFNLSFVSWESKVYDFEESTKGTRQTGWLHFSSAFLIGHRWTPPATETSNSFLFIKGNTWSLDSEKIGDLGLTRLLLLGKEFSRSIHSAFNSILPFTWVKGSEGPKSHLKTRTVNVIKFRLENKKNIVLSIAVTRIDCF